MNMPGFNAALSLGPTMGSQVGWVEWSETRQFFIAMNG